MPKAVWNGHVIAESDHTEMVEGNHYFPPASINWDFFERTERVTTCPWKGQANYYTLKANGDTSSNAAWVYENPKPAAANIKDHIAFYGMVKIQK